MASHAHVRSIEAKQIDTSLGLDLLYLIN